MLVADEGIESEVFKLRWFLGKKKDSENINISSIYNNFPKVTNFWKVHATRYFQIQKK
jgi:hypothetical protein